MTRVAETGGPVDEKLGLGNGSDIDASLEARLLCVKVDFEAGSRIGAGSPSCIKRIISSSMLSELVAFLRFSSACRQRVPVLEMVLTA